MRKVSAWFRTHPLTTICLAIVGFAVGTHLFANWRAEVRWQRYCAAARARGVQLTVAEFTPPEIPDAENFAALPMMRAAFVRGAQASFKLPRPNGGSPPYHNYPKGERIDFKAWAKFFQDAGYIGEMTDSPPRDVLLALEHYAPQFREWSGWRTRKHCRFPMEVDASGFMQSPDFGTFTNAWQIFTLRMRAHLAIGDSPAACADFEDAFQGYRAYENPRSLVQSVLRNGLFAALSAQLGESLETPGWAEPELVKIENILTAANPWADYRQGLAGERVSGNTLYDRLAQSGAQRGQLAGLMIGSTVTPLKKLGFSLIPKRVFRDNQLRQNQFTDELLGRVSADERHFDPDRATPSDPENLKGWLDDYYFFWCKLFSGSADAVGESFIAVQTRRDQARLALALERFRLGRGVFPEKLAELVPDFIAEVPVDTHSQKPLIYRRQEGGTFLLYAVGKNRTDDDGVAGAKGSDGELLDRIWLYAPPPAP